MQQYGDRFVTIDYSDITSPNMYFVGKIRTKCCRFSLKGENCDSHWTEMG